MTTAEQIGRDYVEALEDWEDYMKSRKGLQMLIATYPPNISVECAVGASWLNWVDPY